MASRSPVQIEETSGCRMISTARAQWAPSYELARLVRSECLHRQMSDQYFGHRLRGGIDRGQNAVFEFIGQPRLRNDECWKSSPGDRCRPD